MAKRVAAPQPTGKPALDGATYLALHREVAQKFDDDAASHAIEQLLKHPEVENPRAYVLKAAKNYRIDRSRRAQLESTAASSLKSSGGTLGGLGAGSTSPGGRPADEEFGTRHLLATACDAECWREFRETFGPDGPEADWEVAADLCALGLEMAEQAVDSRRSWLVHVLDRQLGERLPWAVDQGFRQRGALRRAVARGVGSDVPQRHDWSNEMLLQYQRMRASPEGMAALLALLAQVRSPTDIQVIVDAMAEASGRDDAGAQVPPIGDEFLTDRELANVSLLLGNFPSAVAKRMDRGGMATVGDVRTAEIEAIQTSRTRHGMLQSPEEKRRAGVGPKARRKPQRDA